MVEKVTNRKLYHVTVTKPYKRAFMLDQVVEVGAAYNPFFNFYEGSREYPVTVHGQAMRLKAIKFLKEVQAGTLQSPKLADIAVEVAVHYVMLCRELLMEQIRRDEFGCEPPSRQTCLYGCDSVDEARHWKRRLGDGFICELTCTGTIHQSDARLLLGDSEPLSVTTARGRAYWRGDVGSDPEPETLFVGSATVTAFDL